MVYGNCAQPSGCNRTLERQNDPPRNDKTT
jgi:hypothetical protein